MNALKNKWSQLPRPWRLALLLVALGLLAPMATVLLLHSAGVRQVLYQGF
jgi:hypothetical protein